MEKKDDDSLERKRETDSWCERFKRECRFLCKESTRFIYLVYAEPKQIICSKKSALWNNLLLFGCWGFVAVWLLVFKEGVVEQFPILKPSASGLFPNLLPLLLPLFLLLPVSAFLFLCYGSIVIACLANRLTSNDRRCDWFEDFKQYIDNRLTELMSMMFSFSIGMTITIVVYSVFNLTGELIPLLPFILFSNALSLCIYLSYMVITGKDDSFANEHMRKKWRAILFILISSIVYSLLAALLFLERQQGLLLYIIFAGACVPMCLLMWYGKKKQ